MKLIAKRLHRDEARAQTRERLLASAAQVFAQVGYGSASVDLIAESCGYSKGAFYSNFDSKEAILLCLLETHRDREITTLRSMLRKGSTKTQALAEICQYYAAEQQDGNWGLLSAEFQIQAARDPAFAKRFSAYFDEHREALAELIGSLLSKTKQTAKIDTRQLASILMATAVGIALQRKSGEPHPDLFGYALICMLGS